MYALFIVPAIGIAFWLVAHVRSNLSDRNNL